MAKRGSVRRIKANRHYTYRDAADALGFKPQTIRAWCKAGLQVMTDTRPHLILGANLIAFQKARQKPSAKMAPDQLRCFKCGPTRALDRIVFYTPYTPHRGQLEAICEVCGGACFRFEGAKRLGEKARFFEIVKNNAS
jgi:hypothetical protein